MQAVPVRDHMRIKQGRKRADLGALRDAAAPFGIRPCTTESAPARR